MTVAEVFRAAGLLPCGPVRWGTEVLESSAGVYVVARVGVSQAGCKACALPFIDPLPSDIDLDLVYERQRWLKNEPVIYIGQTRRTIRQRIGEFYRHECGEPRPHAGGQIVKLLQCHQWVYWSPATHAKDCERAMIWAFKKQTTQEPFANWDGRRRRKRVRHVSRTLTSYQSLR